MIQYGLPDAKNFPTVPYCGLEKHSSRSYFAKNHLKKNLEVEKVNFI
jgi:hypothetical protein